MFMRGTLAEVLARFNAGASKSRGRPITARCRQSLLRTAIPDRLAVYTRRRVVLIRKHTGTRFKEVPHGRGNQEHHGQENRKQRSVRQRPGSAGIPRQGRPGKLEIVATKPMATQRDLSLAYSPGVAVPVLAIAEDPEPRLRLHRHGQPGRRHLQRHRHPRPRQSRRARLQAGDGRQGGAVQALRRRRFDRPRGRHRGCRRVHQLRALSSGRPSAASTSRTSRRRTASSSSSGCAS